MTKGTFNDPNNISYEPRFILSLKKEGDFFQYNMFASIEYSNDALFLFQEHYFAVTI